MTIHELQTQATIFDTEQMLRIKGGTNSVSTSDTSYIGGVDTDVM